MNAAGDIAQYKGPGLNVQYCHHPKTPKTWKNPKCVSKEANLKRLLSNSIYMTSWKWQSYDDSRRISGCQELGKNIRSVVIFKAVTLLCMIS